MRLLGTAAEHALYPCHYLPYGKWLGDIVVRSQGQAGYLVVLGILGRTENNRNRSRGRILFQKLSHLETAHTAHHDVKQYQRITLQVHLERLFGTIGNIGLIALYLEIELQYLTDRLLIVYYKYLLHTQI